MYQMKFTKPILLNQICTLGNKPNLLKQIYQTKFAKLNLIYKAKCFAELYIYGTDLFCPSHPPSEWLKMIFLRWLKLNFRNGFDCWNLTHHLIKQSRSFFEQKMGCRTLKWVRTARPNLGVFSKFSKYSFFVALLLSF